MKISVTINENVTGFATADLTLDTATVSGFAGTGKNYTFNLIPIAQGVVSATVKASSVQDAATNNNAAAVSISRVFDTTAPASPIISARVQ